MMKFLKANLTPEKPSILRNVCMNVTGQIKQENRIFIVQGAFMTKYVMVGTDTLVVL